MQDNNGNNKKNLYFLNKVAHYYHIGEAAKNKSLYLVTCKALLGQHDIIMTQEALDIVQAAGKGLDIPVQATAITVEDAACIDPFDLPMTREDLLQALYPDQVKATFAGH
jgi:hypothetical protein